MPSIYLIPTKLAGTLRAVDFLHTILHLVIVFVNFGGWAIPRFRSV